MDGEKILVGRFEEGGEYKLKRIHGAKYIEFRLADGKRVKISFGDHGNVRGLIVNTTGLQMNTMPLAGNCILVEPRGSIYPSFEPSDSTKQYAHCKYSKKLKGEKKRICHHKGAEDIPFNIPCNQQNCPWKKRQKNKAFWKNHPGRYRGGKRTPPDKE